MSYLINFTGGRKLHPDDSGFVQTATGTVVNTVTETAITSTGKGSLTFPANFFKEGFGLHICGKGIHSSSGGVNITIRVKLGSTTVLTTGSIASGNDTNAQFDVDAHIICRSTGASGTVMAAGHYEEDGSSPTTFQMVNTTTTTIDTTASQTLSITAQWTVASANNTISLQTLFVEVKTPK